MNLTSHEKPKEGQISTSSQAETVEKRDVLTLLSQIERQVAIPMPTARRRRFWLAWALWGIFGAAVTWSGAPQGAALAMASILTAPLWLLFVVWPVLWGRDRWRARQLWAEDVRLLVDGTFDEEDQEVQEEAVALPIIVGREQGILVPVDAWCTVFPEISREDLLRLGIEFFSAEKFSGVALECMSAETLVNRLSPFAKAQAMTAALRWIERLEDVLKSMH